MYVCVYCDGLPLDQPEKSVSKDPLVIKLLPVAVEIPGTARTIEPDSSFLVAKTLPFAVIDPGETVADVVEVDELQHRSFVLVTFVSGSVGAVKFEV